MTSSAGLREAFGTLLAERPSALVIDLVDVGFFGSSGISALVAAQEQADRGGVRFAVAASGRPVLGPLEVTSVAQILELHPSVEEALDAMESARAESAVLRKV